MGDLPLPLRAVVFVFGLLLAFLAALAVGASVALVVGDGGNTTDPAFSQSSGGTETTMAEGATPEAAAEEAAGPAPVASFVHRATEDNSRGDYTYLSDPSIDGDPDAVVLAEPAPEEGTADDGAYDHNIGVWFEPQRRKWAIFNQDIKPVPVGAAYRVTVPRESASFVHRFSQPAAPEEASASASASAASEPAVNDTTLDNPLVNGKPDARVSVTPNWNPGASGGVYNNHPIDVRYDEGSGRWVIFNRDLAPLEDGASFNVGVSGATEEP